MTRSMEIGDIVLVKTAPPHIASVTDGGQVVCEDGTHLPIDRSSMEVLFTALQIIKELEKGVLGYNETWRLRNC